MPLIVCKNNSSFAFCSEFFPNDIKNKCFIVDADTKRGGIFKLVPIHSYRRLSDLQFMISPKCNLNCKPCSHFSPFWLMVVQIMILKYLIMTF